MSHLLLTTPVARLTFGVFMRPMRGLLVAPGGDALILSPLLQGAFFRTVPMAAVTGPAHVYRLMTPTAGK